MANAKLSQSMMKDLERGDCCPHKFYDRWINQNPWYQENCTNDAMDRGKYFEYKAIGGGSDYGDDVTELPLLKNGNKSAIHERIDTQAERCKRMFTPGDELFIGHKITDVQVKMVGKSTSGTLDFKTVDVETGEEVLWDLKLTADLNSNPRYNPYSWRDVDTVDFTQQIYYKMLHEAVYGYATKMKVLIFDYTVDMNVKIIDVDISEGAKEEVIDRAKEGVKFLRALGEDNERIPSKGECKTCPIADCKFRINENHIEHEQISI